MNTNPMVFIWLVISLLFLMWEMGSPGLFYFLSFFFGSLTAAAVSAFYDNTIIQSVFFLVASVIAFCGLRLWIKKEDKNNHKTNMYALQGKKGIVINEISPNRSGAVKVGGEIWSAHAANNVSITQGALVEVVRVQGAHLIVIELKN